MATAKNNDAKGKYYIYKGKILRLLEDIGWEEGQPVTCCRDVHLPRVFLPLWGYIYPCHCCGIHYLELS